jgi:hypothetical protein
MYKSCDGQFRPDGDNAMWAKFQQIFARIITSTQIEATHDPIAYHAADRGDGLRFSQPSSLRRYY